MVFTKAPVFRTAFTCSGLFISVDSDSLLSMHADNGNCFRISSIACWRSTAFWCFFSYASAVNSNAMDASPSNVEAFRIPKMALTPSNNLPALVDITALIFLSAMAIWTLASCTLHRFSFSIIVMAAARSFICPYSMETAIRHPSLEDASPPIWRNGVIHPNRWNAL